MIPAYRLGLRRIAHGFKVGVYQCCIPPPVFRGGIGEHYLRYLASPYHRRQQGISPAGYRIELFGIGKGEQLCRNITDILGGLTEAEVELSSHSPADMRNDSM